MSCEKTLNEILIQLKELNNRVVSRTNNGVILNHDTAKTKTYQMTDILGTGGKANDLTILSLGGGFTIEINGEDAITATLDFAIEDEDIHSITITGAGAGTAVIRLGAYIPVFTGDRC